MPRTLSNTNPHGRTLRPALFLAVTALLALAAGLTDFVQPEVHAAATFTVNSTGDGPDSDTSDGLCNDGSGRCTLRAAIQQANASAGLDTINFQIGTGVKTIVMTSDLPFISDPVVIDGTTQPGFAGSPIVEVNGNDVQLHAGLAITAGSSTVRGLVLNRFHTAAIGLSNNGGNRVEGCYIGTDVTGTQNLSGGQTGIGIGSSGNFIGGTTPAARNVISGNLYGVELFSGGNGNFIQGNYIGTNASGTLPIGNSSGINAAGGTNNTIGGTAPGAGNLISGNGGDGIGAGTGWTIQGNLIGTNVEGTAAIPNWSSGIQVFGSSCQIGGTTAAARNVISGNGESGIKIVDNATANVVQGNYIGTSADGTRAIPNSTYVGNSSGGIFFRYAKGNTIGGTAPGAGNVIAYNGTGGGYGGVIVAPFNLNVPNTDSRNSIRGNSIYGNLGHGIELPPFGVTPNDPGDADDGANNLQNFPVLTSVAPSGDSTNVQGTFNSKPSTTYALDFYSSTVCDASGNGEGARYVGSTSVTTDAAGDASFNVTLAFVLAPGQVVTATATDPAGNTSEFSACVANGGAPSGTVQLSAASYFVSEGAGFATVNVTRTGGSAGSISVNYSTFSNTAFAGSDFQTTTGTITFADGDTATKSFNVPIIDDNFDEGDENLTVSLGIALGDDRLGAPATALITLSDNDPSPSAWVNDVRVVEGDQGTSDAVFTVRLNDVPTALPITINYSTSKGTATPSADYTDRSGQLVFQPGEKVKTFSVPVIGDTLGEREEFFNVAISVPFNFAVTIIDASGVGTIQDNDPNPLHVVIGEMRFRGAAGTADEFIELFNNSDSPVTVATADGSAGWALVAGDGAARFIVPAGTVIPARGHYLGANTGGYSLGGYPAARGATATPDAGYTADIKDSAGVALFRTANPANFNLSNRLDAVGFGLDLNVNSALYYEAASLRFTGITEDGQHSFVRKRLANGLLKDTDNNQSDFDFVSTNAGTYMNYPSLRGAPGPENLGGPVARAQLPVTLFDESATPSAEPNLSRQGSGNSGTLTIRRRVTNNTGAPLTRLRFRITDLSTTGKSPFINPIPADLQLVDAADADVLRTDGSSALVRGLTVEQPPAQTGGGINTTAAANAVALASPLAPGASLDVQFLFNVVKEGSYTFEVEAQSDATSAPSLQFAASNFTASEADHAFAVTVTRTGDTSGAATVRYATSDGTASERTDYTPAYGTLQFNAGETSKTFEVLLTDDARTEPAETILLALTTTSGALPGTPAAATLTVSDDDATPSSSNPADDSSFFVRQHYHDFLGREPDASGLAFWTGEIEQCGADAGCREVKRINVSAAFFLSIEFQETGYLAYRMYKAAYGDTTSTGVPGTVPSIRLNQFLEDSRQIGQGIVVSQGDWQGQLEARKQAYALEFVRRQRFADAYPLTLTADAFVSKLDQNAGGVLSASEKAQLVASLGATPGDASKRAVVLRSLAEDADLRQAELNRAFVLMQFYGYLRRNPDAPQDTDFRGWKFWLDKLNAFDGDFIKAEMVKAFISSIEYRQRFGQ